MKIKTISDIKKIKVPLVIIDKKLNKLNEVVLFPEKVANAIKVIAKFGIPETYVFLTINR